MTSLRSNAKTLSYVAATAIAAVTMAGCSASAKLAKAGTYGEHDVVRAKQGVDRSVASAERAVARRPQIAALRSLLGLAYLQSGRFASAATAFDDAMRLGDNSPRTALSLALAKVGAGRGREAIAILDDWRDGIPAADLGLALALAGEGGRGVAILTDAVRAGDNSAKLRQNLAYAYALDGRWQEARTMMEQDVPADLIDQRISQWAMQGKAEDYQKRVAGLLGAPVRSDPGLPQALALNEAPGIEQLAAEATAPQPQAVQHPVSATTELPPAADQPAAVPSVAMAGRVIAAPVSAPGAASVPYAPAAYYPAAIEAAPTVVWPSAPLPAAQPAIAEPVVAPAADTATFASAFNGQSAMPHASSAFQAPRRTPRTVRVALPAARPVVARNGSHMVQLGSFSSAQGARRGWGILAASNPRLREYRMVITPAVVNGKNFWRVAAAGFDSNSAGGMCSSVRGRGGVCFAYASNRAPAGALPVPPQGAGGPRMARRR